MSRDGVLRPAVRLESGHVAAVTTVAQRRVTSTAVRAACHGRVTPAARDVALSQLRLAGSARASCPVFPHKNTPGRPVRLVTQHERLLLNRRLSPPVPACCRLPPPVSGWCQMVPVTWRGACSPPREVPARAGMAAADRDKPCSKRFL